ncbi:hypothetical protein ACFQX7_30995 [Luedemannella flava]
MILRGGLPAEVVAAADAAFGDVFADCVDSADGEIVHMAGIDCRVARRTQAVLGEKPPLAGISPVGRRVQQPVVVGESVRDAVAEADAGGVHLQVRQQ